MNRTSEMEHILICLKEHIVLSDDEDNLLLNYIINLQQENQEYKEVIDKAIEFSNKNWGNWCSNHLEYMTELQNILKEVSE